MDVTMSGSSVVINLNTIIDAIIERARMNAATDESLDYGSDPYQAEADVRQIIERDSRQFISEWMM